MIEELGQDLKALRGCRSTEHRRARCEQVCFRGEVLKPAIDDPD
jgi:hypothetical protein